MSALDPVTAPQLTEPTDDELYSAAVGAFGRLMLRRWNDNETATLRHVEWLIDRALEVGPKSMVLLARGHEADRYRLAAAVLATGTPPGGKPGEGDLRAAGEVIDTLLNWPSAPGTVGPGHELAVTPRS